MNYKQFFDTLNENVRKSTTEKSLKSLERLGENYVKNILKNSEVSSVTKKDVRNELQHTKKLIRKIRKKLK